MRGEHNHDISKGKSDDRLVLEMIQDLSESNTPTVAVATAIQPITDNIATQLALPIKENLVWMQNACASNNNRFNQCPQQPEISK